MSRQFDGFLEINGLALGIGLGVAVLVEHRNFRLINGFTFGIDLRIALVIEHRDFCLGLNEHLFSDPFFADPVKFFQCRFFGHLLGANVSLQILKPDVGERLVPDDVALLHDGEDEVSTLLHCSSINVSGNADGVECPRHSVFQILDDGRKEHAALQKDAEVIAPRFHAVNVDRADLPVRACRHDFIEQCLVHVTEGGGENLDAIEQVIAPRDVLPLGTVLLVRVEFGDINVWCGCSRFGARIIGGGICFLFANSERRIQNCCFLLGNAVKLFLRRNTNRLVEVFGKGLVDLTFTHCRLNFDKPGNGIGEDGRQFLEVGDKRDGE